MCSLSASFYIVCFSRFREGSRRQVVVEPLNCMWLSSLALFSLFLSAYRTWHSWCVQSILRQANFKGAKLLGASFFDSDLTGHHHHPAHLKTSWRQILYKWLEAWTGVCTLARIWNLVPWDGCFFLQETTLFLVLSGNNPEYIMDGWTFWLEFSVTGADLSDADLRGADFSLANAQKVTSKFYACANVKTGWVNPRSQKEESCFMLM